MYFLPVCSLSFHFLNSVICGAKFFSFVVQFGLQVLTHLLWFQCRFNFQSLYSTILICFMYVPVWNLCSVSVSLNFSLLSWIASDPLYTARGGWAQEFTNNIFRLLSSICFLVLLYVFWFLGSHLFWPENSGVSYATLSYTLYFHDCLTVGAKKWEDREWRKLIIPLPQSLFSAICLFRHCCMWLLECCGSRG